MRESTDPAMGFTRFRCRRQIRDLDAIADVLLRVSALVESHSEIAELDLNPVVATPDGALVLDARVRVETAPPEPPMPSLRA